MQRRHVRALGGFLLSLVAVTLTAGIGWGAVDPPPGVVVTTDDEGADAVSVSRTDDGGFSGSITLSNTTSESYILTIEGAGRLANCPLTVTPATLADYRTSTLEIATKQSCEVSENGETVVLGFDGAPSGELEVTVTEETTTPVQLSALLPPFGWAAVAAFVVLAGCFFWINGRTYQKSETGKAQYDTVRDPVTGVVTWEAVTDTVKWGTRVSGAPTGWTFKDSWASNLSVGTTVFIALFGSKEILKAIFGDAPEETLSQLLIVGAVAGLLVALAPLVVKTIGTSTLPTVGGLVTGALFTLTGVLGQILAIAWILRRDELDEKDVDAAVLDQVLQLAKAGDEVAIIALALAAFLLVHALWTLHVLLVEAFPAPKEKTEPDAVPNDLLLVAATVAEGLDNEEAIAQALRLAAKGAERYNERSEVDDDYPAVDSVLPTSRGDDQAPPLPSVIL